MDTIVLSELWRFGVKSLRGERHARLPVAARGLAWDRHWMLVDLSGRFLTQRQQPRMTLLQAGVTDGALVIRAPGGECLRVPDAPPGAPEIEVQIWRDSCPAVAPDPAADRWLSRFLGQPCRLVHLPERAVRRVDPEFAGPDDQVGLADGFPFLLISQASLDDLNRRLADPVPMLRFRPNLVVSGCEPYAEDRWRRIRIGAMTFRVAKPCARCIIPTIDPATAQRAAEPLRTLRGYRQRGNRILFGQNLLHDGPGTLAQGMPLEVLETTHD